MSVILIALAIPAIYLLSLYYVKNKWKTNIPGIKGTWPYPIGNIFWFSGVKNAEDMFNLFAEIFKICDRALTFWLGPKLVVFVKDPVLIEGILASSKCNTKDELVYGAFNKVADGVFSRNGKGWSNMRRPLDKLLQPKLLENDHSVLMKRSVKLCDTIDEELCGKGTVMNLPETVFHCTLDIVSEALIGVRTKDVPMDTSRIPSMLSQIVDLIFYRILKFPYQLDFFFDKSSMAKSLKGLTDECGRFTDFAIESRYKEYQKSGIQPEDPNFVHKYFTDIVIQVIRAEGLPYDRLRGSLYDFIIAGSDTSTITISSVILFLAMHPEYQEKVYQEQIKVMGESHLPPTMDQISKMTYLTMVYNETLRHVSVPGIIRNVSSELTLEGFNFPKGCSPYIAFHEVAKLPEYWEKPNDFYPDHFLPEKTAVRPKGAFLPFSSGPRSCPGKQFAMLTNRVILSLILRKFTFTTHLKFHEMVYEYKIMVESLKGYPVEITKRPPLPCK